MCSWVVSPPGADGVPSGRGWGPLPGVPREALAAARASEAAVRVVEVGAFLCDCLIAEAWGGVARWEVYEPHEAATSLCAHSVGTGVNIGVGAGVGSYAYEHGESVMLHGTGPYEYEYELAYHKHNPSIQSCTFELQVSPQPPVARPSQVRPRMKGNCVQIA